MRNIKYKYTVLVMLAILIPVDIHLWRQYVTTKTIENMTYAICVLIFIVGIIGYYLTRQFYKRNGEKVTATIIKTYYSYADAYKEVYGKSRRRRVSDSDDIYAVVEYNHNGQKIKNLLYIPHPHSENFINTTNVGVPVVIYKNKCIFDDDAFVEKRKENKGKQLSKKEINKAINNSNLVKTEIDVIYEQVGTKYNLTLNQIVIKDQGEAKAEKTISYKNDLGNMRLFKMGAYIVFAVTYADGQKIEIKLQRVEDAVNAIEKFMNNDRNFEE